MGCDCTNYLPKGTSSLDVEEYMGLLGYEKVERSQFTNPKSMPFSFWKDDNYRYTGIYSEVAPGDDGGIQVWTRTTIWRSRFDSEYHNYTVKQLKKRFGGYFISDEGKNRYFKNSDEPKIEKAEGGCYAAYSRFHRNLVRAIAFIMNQSYDKDDFFPIRKIDFVDSMNPKIVSTNLVIPFLVSILEDYFRSSYVALLKYSTKKTSIVQNAKLSGPDLLAVSNNELSVEEAVSRWRSFQDIEKINNSFKELDNRIDIHGILKKPYRRRKESFYEALVRLIKQRHELIHRADIDYTYYPENVIKDIDTVGKSIERVYRHLIKLYKWSDKHPDL